MSTEQSFSSQVEAVMQRGRRGAEKPQDAEVLADIMNIVAQSQVAGEGILTNIVGTSTAWRGAIETLQTQYNSDPTKQDVLASVARALPTASRERMLEQAGIPLDVNKENRDEHSEKLDTLRHELRFLARQSLFAELTDPKTDTSWSRSGNTMKGNVDRHRNAILPVVGMSGSLNSEDFLSRWMQREPPEEVWSEHRANNRVLTEAMIARFLDRSPLEFRRVSGAYQGNDVDYTAPTHEAMQNEAVREQYKQALVTLLDGLDADTDWSQEQREQMRQGGTFATDRLGRAHYTFVSHLFDGIDFRDVLRPGQDLRTLLEHTQRSDPDGARTASFARGVALRVLIEGGDIVTYTQAMSALPVPERQKMGEVAQLMYRKCTSDEDRTRITTLLRDVHNLTPTEVRNTEDPARAMAERTKRQADAEQMIQAAKEQIENCVLRVSMEDAQMRKGSEVVSAVAEELQLVNGNVPDKVRALGKQLVWAKVTQDVFMAELTGSAQKYIEGSAKTTDYAELVGQVLKTLERMNEVKNTDDTVSYRVDRESTALEPHLQKAQVLARFAGVLLSSRYFHNETNMAYLMARTLHNAQHHPETLGGVTQEDILEVYNRTMIAVAGYNEAVGRVNSNFQISMTDGLAYALQNPTSWKTPGYESVGIQLPSVVEGGVVHAPGLTSYHLDRKEKREGQFVPLHIKDGTAGAHNSGSLESDTQQWAEQQTAPVVQVLEQIRRAKQYPATVTELSGARAVLESMSYVPSTESIFVSEDMKPILDTLTPFIQQVKNLAEIDDRERAPEFTARRDTVLANRKAFGQEATDAIHDIEQFLSGHGDELRNPPKRFGLDNHSEDFKQAKAQLEQTLKALYARLGLDTKKISLKQETEYNLARATVERSVSDPQNAELVSLRKAMQDLGEKVPTPEVRVRTYLASHTEPPYDPESFTQALGLIRMPIDKRGKPPTGFSAEYKVADLFADHNTAYSAAQQLTLDFLVKDHAWSAPIFRDIHMKREAVKQNAGGTALAKEIEEGLLTIEQRLTKYPQQGDKILPDRQVVATEVLRLFKRTITPLVMTDTIRAVDTSPVASVGAGLLQTKLDIAVKGLTPDYTRARWAMDQWEI